MTRIDVHHHIIPPIYKQNLQKINIFHSGGREIIDWKPQDSLDFMDILGIDTAICSISEPALYPFLAHSKELARKVAREINTYMGELCRKYPKKFGAFAVLPMPDVESSLAEIDYALNVLKLDGIGMLSNYQAHFLGDKCFEPVFKKLNNYEAVVYVHPSVPEASYVKPQFMPLDFLAEFCFNTTRAAANLIFSGTMERYPRIKFIFSHMGGTLPYLAWRLNTCQMTIQNIKERPAELSEMIWNGWKDMKKSVLDYVKSFYFDTALATHDIAFYAGEQIAHEHIMFGSDSFYAPLEKGRIFVKEINRYYGHDEQLLYDINRGNAEKLFVKFKQS